MKSIVHCVLQIGLKTIPLFCKEELLIKRNMMAVACHFEKNDKSESRSSAAGFFHILGTFPPKKTYESHALSFFTFCTSPANFFFF